MRFLMMTMLLFGSLEVLANEEQYFLNSQEFKSLNRDQQAKYIKGVQKILAEMTKKTLYMAEKNDDSFSTNSRLPASVIPAHSDTAAPAKDDVEITALIAKKTKLAAAAKAQAAAIPATEDPHFSDVAKEGFTIRAQDEKKADHVATQPPQVATTTSGPKVTAAATKPVEASTKGHAYRCMYSGWVIQEDPCKAVEKFPSYFSIQDVDNSKMVCPGKTICNPIVFGLKFTDPKCKSLNDGDCGKKAVPICAKKGAWPTQECYHLSTYQSALVVAELWEKDPVQLNHYQEAFVDLCSASKIENNPFAKTKNGEPRTAEKTKAIQNDIRLTCDWAKKQLRDLKETTEIEKMAEGKDKEAARAKWNAKKAAKPVQKKSDESSTQK